MSALLESTPITKKRQEVLTWISTIRQDVTVLDLLHPETARYWKEQVQLVEVMEKLLLRSIDSFNACKSEMSEQTKMSKVFGSINSELTFINKSWGDMNELLDAKLLEVGNR